jgi:hypothetical protein
MSAADDLRAMCLQAMSEHAAIRPRGFDTIARRADLHRQWDELYDDYVLELAVEQAPTTAAATEPTP